MENQSQIRNYVSQEACLQPPIEMTSSFMSDMEQDNKKEEERELLIADDPEFEYFDRYKNQIFFDKDDGKYYHVEAIQYDNTPRPGLNIAVGFIASCLECDINGRLLSSNFTTNGFPKDTAFQPYTLQGNEIGCTMGDMINDYNTELVKNNTMMGL